MGSEEYRPGSGPGICWRCGNYAEIRYPHIRSSDGMTYIFRDTDSPIPNELQEKVWLCWDCDFDVINGGPMEVDPAELEMDREQQAYDEDPINNPPPSWMRRGRP